MCDCYHRSPTGSRNILSCVGVHLRLVPGLTSAFERLSAASACVCDYPHASPTLSKDSLACRCAFATLPKLHRPALEGFSRMSVCVCDYPHASPTLSNDSLPRRRAFATSPRSHQRFRTTPCRVGVCLRLVPGLTNAFERLSAVSACVCDYPHASPRLSKDSLPRQRVFATSPRSHQRFRRTLSRVGVHLRLFPSFTAGLSKDSLACRCAFAIIPTL